MDFRLQAPGATPDFLSSCARRIAEPVDIADGLRALVELDPRLAPVLAAAGDVPLRRRAAGFEGLAAVITSQQISIAAAASIWSRLAAAIDPFTPERFLQTSDEALRTAGLSRPKMRTLASVAAACRDGFDFERLHALDAPEALAALTALKGIGPWTAEVYLLFCVGHADIFPAGDLALQTAVQRGLGLPERPTDKALRAMAQAWSPWRGVAAGLFWAYYRAQRGTDILVPKAD